MTALFSTLTKTKIQDLQRILNCVAGPVNDTYLLLPVLNALQIEVDVGTVDSTGKMTPCLVLSIRGLGTNAIMHPWDLTASASLSSLAVADVTYGSERGPLYLVQTPVGAELLSVTFLKVVIISELIVVVTLLGESECILNSLQVSINKVWNIMLFYIMDIRDRE